MALLIVNKKNCILLVILYRLAAALEDEVNSLQRKIDYLESAKSSLVAQVSILEETVAKYEQERKEFAKR